MASRFWVGGSASWDGTAGTKWATISGGSGGAAVPTSADDVFFDGASGAVTVTISSGTVNCNNLDWSGFTGTWAGTSIIHINGSLTISATVNKTSTNLITFLSTTTGNTITTNGKTIHTPTFNGVGGEWILQDNLTVGNGASVVFTAGTLRTNDKTISTLSDLNSQGSGVRALYLGNSTVSCANVIFSGSNFTFDAGTSNLTAFGSTFTGGGKTFYNVTINNGITVTMSGSNTFNTLTISDDQTCKFTDGTTQTVSSFIATATTVTRITLTGTSTQGWTISDGAGTNTVSYCTISYSRATGGARWLAPIGLGNVAGASNSGWTFTDYASKGSLGEIVQKVDAYTGLPLGEGYIVLVTSAGNGLPFLGPREAELYRAAHPEQIKTGGRDDRVPINI